jgi:UDP-3-O-[3-hydroxymyristoyl] glucosamine N-acyltransferase
MTVRLGELAVRFGCELRGDPDVLIERVATLHEAAPGSIAFLANPRYRRFLGATRASCVVLAEEAAADCPVAALVSRNPYATYARIAQLLYPEPEFAPGRHPTAVVEDGAVVDPSAHLGALSFVASGATIGPRAVIGPGSVVLAGARVGAGTRLVARVTLCEGVQVGARCLLLPGSVIGADGFGHAPEPGGYVKVPQVGSVLLGDDVEVGANSTIDRGAIGDTLVEDGVKIDNQVQVGHNAHIGAHTVIAGCVGISGSASIGRRCMIGGMVGIAGHLEICDDVAVTGKTLVSASIRKPGLYSGALPAAEARAFRRNSARFQQLDGLARRVRRLEGAAGAEDAQGDDDE